MNVIHSCKIVKGNHIPTIIGWENNNEKIIIVFIRHDDSSKILLVFKTITIFSLLFTLHKFACQNLKSGFKVPKLNDE